MRRPGIAGWRTERAVRGYLGRTAEPKLHLGCGGAILGGWLNSDRAPRRGVVELDVTRPFPLPSEAFGVALAEHVIEHVPLEAGRSMLRECARVLRPGGRVRVSTPDLARLAALLNGAGDDPGGARYLDWMRHAFVPGARGSGAALVLNNAFHNWGHRFLYDEATLATALLDAGLADVRRLPYRVSEHPALHRVEGHGIDPIGIEMRSYETLALEARRT